MTTATLGSDPLIGFELQGYRIQRRLGEGGMGLVYEGLQPEIGKRVAIKILKPEVSGDFDLVERLIAEARAVNAIRHRGIVDIFASAKLPDGRQAIIMEYLEGKSLETELAEVHAEHRTLPLLEVLSIIDEVLSALGAAHRAGVVHRDLKPSNIYLCRSPSGERHVKLLDFGIAKMGVVGEVKASVVLGTPSYMAPEQARGELVGPALDLYAIGVILFEMITGGLPYVADNAVRVIYMHIEAPIPLPSARLASVPGALDSIVTRLLAKQASERYPSVDALRLELNRFKAALADPSALTTIDSPSAPFDEKQPIEGTFIRATTPPLPARTSETANQALLLEASQKSSSRARMGVVLVVALGVAGLGWWAVRAESTAEPAITPQPRAALPLETPPVKTPPVETPVENPPSKPQPLAPTPDPTPKPSQRAVLQAKLGALERAVSSAKRKGADMELIERQVTLIRTRLAASPGVEELEQLQTALERLGEDVRAE